MNYVKLYEQLGYLFYAIAAADNDVNQREKDRLRLELNKIWIPLEDSRDRFGSDAAHYIFIAFDFLNENMTPAEEAFEQFRNYYHDEHIHLQEDLKTKIKQTASAIASSFLGKNKTELVYLTKLERLLRD